MVFMQSFKFHIPTFALVNLLYLVENMLLHAKKIFNIKFNTYRIDLKIMNTS